jgi:ferric-dicitrate binding protein FerR (iron transport regulator)
MAEPLDWDEIDRYFAGELSEADAAQLRRWLMVHPDKAQVLESVAQALDGTIGVDDSGQSDALVSWDAVAARIRSEDEGLVLADVMRPAVSGRHLERVSSVHLETSIAPLGTRSIAKSRNIFSGQTRQRALWSVAASLVLGVVVMVLGWTAGVRHVSQRAAMSMLAYTTGSGERATITLPDGGTVALNVASRLEVPMDYMTGNRVVRLNGEGLFSVPHNSGAPLTVIAGATAARVLGTSFVVRHYATDSVTTVAVRDGKVAVGSVVLTANWLLEVGRYGVVSLRSAEPGVFGFATGVLTLDDLFLPKAIPELDRWYDVDIRLGDPELAKRGVGGKFAAGSIADLTAILELTLDVRVMRDGRVLTLMPR